MWNIKRGIRALSVGSGAASKMHVFQRWFEGKGATETRQLSASQLPRQGEHAMCEAGVDGLGDGATAGANREIGCLQQLCKGKVDSLLISALLDKKRLQHTII